jgi:hypothetical protein
MGLLLGYLRPFTTDRPGFTKPGRGQREAADQTIVNSATAMPAAINASWTPYEAVEGTSFAATH